MTRHPSLTRKQFAALIDQQHAQWIAVYRAAMNGQPGEALSFIDMSGARVTVAAGRRTVIN